MIVLVVLSALATVSLADAQPVPTFEKAFDPSPIGPGSVSTLRFHIVNPDPIKPVSDLAFTDVLPADVVIASPANAVTDCTAAAMLSAPAGGTTIDFSGGGVGPLGACFVSVDVTSPGAGSHTDES